MKEYELTIGKREMEALKESITLAIDVLHMKNQKIADYLNLNKNGLGILDKLKIKLFENKMIEGYFNEEIEKKSQMLKILNSKFS